MKTLAPAAALLVLLSSCSRAPSTSETSSVIDADAPRWPNPRLIPICFVNRNAVDQEIYIDLLNTAVREFGRAGVGFQKWRDCSEEDFRKADQDSLAQQAMDIDEVVRQAVAEHSLNPQNIEAAIRQALLPRLFELMGLDKAREAIDHVIQVTRVGLARGGQ